MNPNHITYSDKFQKNYRYKLTEPVGKNFHIDFKPQLTPKEMLKLGVFGGAYFIGVKGLIPKDLPKSWFLGVELPQDEQKHAEYNFFGISASQSLKIWQEKGWIHADDPHGWFQWYCRYYLGRRHADDARQIKRWKAFRRHVSAVWNNCERGDLTCRRKQRQALLHWAYDGRI
ncbi:MAG: hypothetical protein HYV41_02560 [Candidatus Magasanikbacteria bacterium]|nr:hypothetical protein [Candidatus Magasanikbacteria bacterium]